MMTLTLKKTLKKMKDESLSCWKLFSVHPYSHRLTLYSSFMEKDNPEKSLEYLKDQVESANEVSECVLEIHACTSPHSNGELKDRIWRIADAKEKGNQNNGNNNSNPVNGLGALGMYDSGFIQNELGAIRSEKIRYEDLLAEVRKQEIGLVMREAQVKHKEERLGEMKQSWEQTKKEFEEKLKEKEATFENRVKAGEKALSNFFDKVIGEFGDGDSGGDLSGSEPTSPEDMLIQSLAVKIQEAELSEDQIKSLGILVVRKIKDIKQTQEA